MNYVTFHAVTLEFSGRAILKEVDFALAAGERVCLIGRNGAGKSTMMKLINGELDCDAGEIRRHPDIEISQLAQTLPTDHTLTVTEYVAAGLAKLRHLHTEFARLMELAPAADAKALDNLQRRIEARGGWNVDQRVATTLSELDLPGDRMLGKLSGGWQRRVSLARALVGQPDLLLLDEPTNHLDLSTIRWLENKVYAFDGSILFVTHDRAFLQRLATRIVEIDRGRLTSWPGNYRTYLANKEKFLRDEARDHALFNKKLAQEERWIRQGIKARRTRNMGRVRALEEMRTEVATRLKPDLKPRIHVEEAERSGRKVIEARNLSYGFGEISLIERFSIKIMRGDRIGLIGNNGVGKSTLLRLLLGEIKPDAGTLKLGTKLLVGYFDQMRRELDPDKTVAEIVGGGRDYISVKGKDRHVIGYLRGFLFEPGRAQLPVKALSGGECNRAILARLFARPSNLLVLDEPTNDLDIETLEVLEARLSDYQGTLIVVSHDREFLDNVVSSVLVFEDSGCIERYAGGFSDWHARGKRLAEREEPQPTTTKKERNAATQDRSSTRGKLSYKHKYELEQLPDRIELLETQIADLQAQTAVASFYEKNHEHVRTTLQKLAAAQVELDALVERWAELESLPNS